MKLKADWITAPATQAVMRALSDHQALFVGGCVRNALLGKPVSDIDIATDAPPDQVLELAKSAGLRAIPTGVEHGTITILSGGQPFEVTTFRRDVETDGRHAKVAFSTDMTEDAARRDFTMNALYADASGIVIDPLGGLPDLQAGQVRFIGDASARIHEDHLRILRFYRFHAWYGTGQLDPSGRAACTDLADGIDMLSAERITMELRKLLCAPRPLDAISAMSVDGVLDHILPQSNTMLIGAFLAAEITPNWHARLFALGGTTDKLRLSKEDTRTLTLARTAFAWPGSTASRAYKFGTEAAETVSVMHAALLRRAVPSDEKAEINRGSNAVCPVKAADLINTIPPGPALGEALTLIEDEWIACDFAPDKATLLRWFSDNA